MGDRQRMAGAAARASESVGHDSGRFDQGRAEVCRRPGLPWRTALGDGWCTLPSALLAAVVVALSGQFDVGRDGAATTFIHVAATGSLVTLGVGLARQRLARTGRLRRPSLILPALVVLGHVLAALLVASTAPADDATTLAVLVLTSPGVTTVVVDGSSWGRGLLRVMLAMGLVGPAVIPALAGGFVSLLLGMPFGHTVAAVTALAGGVAVGHLVTYVPLALVGPGVHGESP